MPGAPDKAAAHVGTRTNQGSRIDYITEKPPAGVALEHKFLAY